MAAFNKINSFLEACFEKQHDFANDEFRLVFTDVAPTADNAQLSDLTEIGAGSGYNTGGNVINISNSSQTSGTYTAALDTDVTFTATGGTIGPFRYVTCYNNTSTGDLLVSYYDRGASLTLQDGETFTIEVGSSLFTAT